MTPSAQLVLRASQLKPYIGKFAARRMVERASIYAGARLYRIACQLLAVEKS